MEQKTAGQELSIKERVADFAQRQDVFVGYGLTLKPVGKKDLDMICRWRNSKEIVPLMDNTFKTNKLSLNLWFARISKEYTCLPYIIAKDGEDVGYVEFKNFDFNNKTCEQGVFLDSSKLAQGIGTRLNFLQEKVLRSLGVETLRLHIRKINECNLHIWKSLGAALEACDETSVWMKSDRKERWEALEKSADVHGYAQEWIEFIKNSQGAQ